MLQTGIAPLQLCLLDCIVGAGRLPSLLENEIEAMGSVAKDVRYPAQVVSCIGDTLQC